MEQNDNNTLVLASWSQRIINYIVDITFISLTCILIAAQYEIIDLETIDPLDFKMPKTLQYLVFSCTFIYYFFFEFFLGKTIGKFLTNTRVVTLEGEKPNLKAISIRSVIRIFGLFYALTFLFLMPRNIGGIHDLVTKTRVIDEKESFS